MDIKLVPSTTELKNVAMLAAGGVAAGYASSAVKKWASEGESNGVKDFIGKYNWTPAAITAVVGFLLMNYQKTLGMGVVVGAFTSLFGDLLAGIGSGE